MSRPLPAVFLVLLVWSFALPAAEKNIILFVADDMGTELGCYGDKVARTPNMDTLASQGTRFTHAFCTTASCSASRSVILTGLHNHANGHYGHEHVEHHFSSFSNIKSLPVLLADAGYRTARVGKFHVAPEEVYKFQQIIPANAASPVAMADACKPLFDAGHNRPFFLYFCTVDPHRRGGPAAELPHKPDRFGNPAPGKSHPGVQETVFDPGSVPVPGFLPDLPETRSELAQYYQSVSRLDQGVGRLIQHLKDAGLYEQTLIIVISDNGVAFAGAKTNLYEPGMRLPCIVRNPYLQTPAATNAMVTWADLTPTILDFAGATPPDAGFHGRSFLRAMAEENPVGWDEVYASHTFHEVTMYYPMRVVRDRRYKLTWNIAHALPFPFASDLWQSVTWQAAMRQGTGAKYGRRTLEAYTHRPRFELYDLERDPDELHNLAEVADHAARLEAMKGKLKHFQKTTKDPWVLKWEYE